MAIHTILHSRSVYPQSAFEQRKCYGVPVFMCRHPEVAAGISTLMASLRAPIAAGSIEAVAVALLDASGSPAEHYKIDIVQPHGQAGAATYSDVDTQLASALARIATSQGGQPHKEGSWTVFVKHHDVLAGPVDGSGVSTASGPSGLGFPPSAAKNDMLGGRSPWVRADAARDRTARQLEADPREGMLQLKTVRVGSLCLDIRHEYPGML